ncbi:hypothetical protein [Klebsiella michiganensis]|uniref:tail fiber/spike domain-containing protein n=1 Tax=Klebsiella michiganensis TaxID=1134687 RepID=UPI002113DC9A|nr:hypothetical protein [Klebsiella michiganensis]
MPATPQDRLYGLTTSVAVKPPVFISVDYDVARFGEQTITSKTPTDERTITTTEGMRVLLLGQDNPVENGIWVARRSFWVRATDFNGPRDAVNGTLVFSINGDCWQVEADDPVVIGKSVIHFRPTYPFEANLDIFQRTLRVPEASVGVLPSAEDRAWKGLGFDGAGQPKLQDPAGTGLWGYVPAIGSFEKGSLLTQRFEVLLWESTDEYWRWDGEFPKSVSADSTPETAGGTGKGMWIDVTDATLRANLGSDEEGLGDSLVMHSNGLTVAQMLESRNAINVMEFIPTDLWQYIRQDVNAAGAIAGAGDLYQYIFDADAVAFAVGKSLFFPAGQYPISQTFYQTARWVVGVFGASFLVPYTSFPTGNWLHVWPASTGQPRLTSIGLSYDGLGNTRGDFVGGFLLGTGCHSSEISSVFARNCWLGGLRIYPLGAARDIVNFRIERVYLLDCGSAANNAGFSIELSSGTTAITDGSIRDIDISGTNSDTTNSVGPMAFTITTNSKAMFNVVMERFFTSTRLNTHVKTASNSRYLFTGCVMRQFSGETHAYINGVDTNGYFTSLPQVSLQAGYRNRFEQMYAHGALNNAGLQIVDGIEPVFDQWTFQPGQNQDMSGNYLKALQIDACDNATFRDCSIRNIVSTSYDAPWKNAFTKYMVDNGTNTAWESSMMTNAPAVLHPRSFYSDMTLKSGSTTLYYPTNAISYGSDILFTAASGALVMGFPSTSNTTDDQNVQFPLLTDPGQGTVDYYYLTAKLTMTAGDINNWYIAFQMFATSWSVAPTALNTEYIINARFAVTSSTVLNRLIIHIGHSAAVSSACSFKLSDIILTTDRHTYPFRYKKVQQVV